MRKEVRMLRSSSTRAIVGIGGPFARLTRFAGCYGHRAGLKGGSNGALCTTPFPIGDATNIVMAQVNNSSEMPSKSEIAADARTLVRRAFKGSLASLDGPAGAPYASLITLASDPLKARRTRVRASAAI